ncbi:EamA family transporter [Verticiella sediminum]|uniref:EamA family transporter n=2 Tax=Verticiella sediminum TaxID=1247510 RepID=A0A556AJM2_9BURK|nr:EamA family transporter [Verticiella sediminum]
MSAKEWSLLCGLSLLWGASFFFTGVAVQELPPLTIVLLRVGLGALTLYAVLRASGGTLPGDARAWRDLAVLGVINSALPFTLIVWGQTQIPSGLASILNATTPLFGVLAAHLCTQDERITSNRLAGVVIGFAGVALMVGAGALRGGDAPVAGQLAILGAACSYAIAGVYARRLRRYGLAPMVAATGQIACATLILLPLALLVERPWQYAMPGAATWFAVAGSAVLSTALAYVIYFRLIATAGATNILLVTFLVPVSAILLGWLVLGERLEPRHFLGMALIAGGLAALDGRLLRRRRGAPLSVGGSGTDRGRPGSR